MGRPGGVVVRATAASENAGESFPRSLTRWRTIRYWQDCFVPRGFGGATSGFTSIISSALIAVGGLVGAVIARATAVPADQDQGNADGGEKEPAGDEVYVQQPPRPSPGGKRCTPLRRGTPPAAAWSHAAWISGVSARLCPGRLQRSELEGRPFYYSGSRASSGHWRSCSSRQRHCIRGLSKTAGMARLLA